MDAPRELIFYHSRWQSLRAALILSVFVMMGLAVWYDWLPMVFLAKLLVCTVAGASGLLCVFFLARAVRPVPVLRATSEGIAYNFNWRFPQGEFRRWEDMADIVTRPDGLGIVLTEEYLSRQKSVKAELLSLNMRQQGVHELVPLLMLPSTPTETVELLRRTYFMVRPPMPDEARGASELSKMP